MQNKKHFTIGIDEVGRGSLAGPVFVGVAAVSKDGLLAIKNAEKKNGKIKDSKKLSPKKRNEWFLFFKENKDIFFNIKMMNPPLIDKLNISKSANILALRAFKKIVSNKKIGKMDYDVFLDGGLYLGDKRNIFEINGINKKAKTIIKGDEKIIAIRVASIAAKVLRDFYMVKISKKYKKYNFDINKGYGTRFHINAIKKYGASDIHRKTFIKSFIK
jgi:ribonuclease HII